MPIIYQTVAIATEDIADSIASGLSREEIIEFIKAIDLSVADWDFTNELITYFKQQEKVFVDEIMEHGA